MFHLISYKRPISIIVVANILAFALLYFYKKPFDRYIFIAGLLVTGLIVAAYLVIIKKGLGDEYLFLIVSMLASLGFIMTYRLDKELGFKQILWFIVGILLFFLSYYCYIKVRFWDKLMLYYIAGSYLLFLLTLGMGKSIRGSKNWIAVAGFTFQPSELIKICFIFFLACYFKAQKQFVFPGKSLELEKTELKRKLILSGITFSFIGFLILQKEWGTILLLCSTYLLLLYTFDDSIRFFLVNTSAVILGGVAGVIFVYHVRVRVEMWLNPWGDIAGKGYQITQSLFAIGSGGFFGTGIGLGRPDYIPEVNTDFIFSAICEEMGLFGGVAVILLFFILSYRGFKITISIRDTFERVVALGITIMFGIQTFIIIGGVIKLIPLTGITLPFISYGGSSLTTGFLALGILQALSSNHSRIGEEDEVDATK